MITLDDTLDESVQLAGGVNLDDQASVVITNSLPNNGSISNFVSSREGFAVGPSVQGEAMLGVPHNVTIDYGITNGERPRQRYLLHALRRGNGQRDISGEGE